MPPFDPFGKEGMLATLIRLANENDQSWRFTKKGDKRPAYDVEAGKAAKLAKRKAKQEAATERHLAAMRKRNSTARPAGEDIASRMLKAMAPGAWVGMGDLMRMTGESRTSRGKVQVLLARGWVEAARNPAWRGRSLNPQEIMAGAEPEPMTLYRLTEAGLQRREELARLP